MGTGRCSQEQDRPRKMFPEELGNDRGDQVMLMTGVGCPCWQHPGPRCSALPALMSPCRDCALHGCAAQGLQALALPHSSHGSLSHQQSSAQCHLQGGDKH